MTFADGTEFEDWTRLDFDRSRYLAFFGNNEEWKIPLQLVDGYSKIKVGLKAGGKNMYDADSAAQICVEVEKESPIFIDGKIEDLLQAGESKTKCIEDRSADGLEKNYLDINDVCLLQSADYLYIGTRFYSVPDIPDDLTHTYAFKAANEHEKTNFWIQANASTGVFHVMKFEDGVSFENWTRLEYSPYEYQFELDEHAEIRIPIGLFGGFKKISFQYMAGGEKAWNADETDWLELEL